jgi:hypothetical protein
VLVCALWRTDFLLHAKPPSMVEPPVMLVGDRAVR